jgi:hypothetical protein
MSGMARNPHLPRCVSPACMGCAEDDDDATEIGAGAYEDADDGRGTCDVCDRRNVRLNHVTVAGVETWACSKCRGEPPRRCETGECDHGGECGYCGAWNGEACLDR